MVYYKYEKKTEEIRWNYADDREKGKSRSKAP